MSYSPITEAVMFFDADGHVCKEMLFQEFEAILDGVVYLQEFANKLLYSAYVQINSRLQVKAAVGFQVDFDEEGRVDRDWNIPLDHLVSQMNADVDLAGQRIKVVGRSNCPVSWHADALWDLKPGHLKQIVRAAERNMLGVLVDETPEEEEISATPMAAGSAVDVAEIRQQLQARFQQLYQERSHQLLDQQRANLRDLKQNYKDQLARLEAQHQAQLGEYKSELREQEKELHQQIRMNRSLQEQLRTQANSFSASQAEMTRQLQELAREGGDQPDLAQTMQQEIQQQVAQATRRLQQQLEIKEMELNYRNELDLEMQEQIQQLESQVAALAAEEPDPKALIRQLHDKGVVLVAFQPGAGHISLPQKDIDLYLEDPIAYAARYCRVDRALYEAWLQHYHQPSCEHRSRNNVPCGQPVERVSKPGDFVLGQSNRCRLHKE